MLIITNKASVVSSALFFFFFVLCLNQYLEKQRHSLPEPGAILKRHNENEKEIHSPGCSQFPICFITVASGRVVKQGDSFFVCFIFFILGGFIYLFYFFTLQYCIGFAIHWHESAMGVHVFSILSLWVIPVYQPREPCIMHWTWTVIHFTYDNLHVSMPFSHIIPLSLPESKDCPIHLSLFCCLTYRVIVTIFLNFKYMH